MATEDQVISPTQLTLVVPEGDGNMCEGCVLLGTNCGDDYSKSGRVRVAAERLCNDSCSNDDVTGMMDRVWVLKEVK